MDKKIGNSYVKTVATVTRDSTVADAAGRLIGIVSFDDVLLQRAEPIVAMADLAVRERQFETSTRG